MAELITGIQAAQRARKKPMPRAKTQMFITPGWEEPEMPPTVESRYKEKGTDEQRKRRRLQYG